MPELPEVEVVKRSLTNKIQKLVVERITVKDEKLRYRVNKNKLKVLIGLKITKILRRSKFLLFMFERNIVMLVHLGMTGKYLLDLQNPVEDHSVLVLVRMAPGIANPRLGYL